MPLQISNQKPTSEADEDHRDYCSKGTCWILQHTLLRHLLFTATLSAMAQSNLVPHLLTLITAHVLDLMIAVHNAEQIEQLTLVFMDALDLDVHEGLGIEGNACQLLHLGHSLLLRLQLHGLPLALELFVVCFLLQPLPPQEQVSTEGTGLVSE